LVRRKLAVEREEKKREEEGDGEEAKGREGEVVADAEP
jgi:hypothetical protein